MKKKAMSLWLKTVKNMLPLKEIWKQLRAKLIGHYRYYGISGNYARIASYHHDTMLCAFKWRNRRSRKKSFTWVRIWRYVERYLVPKPRIYHNPYRLTLT
jgi:RNA-directed DNA polymerase